MENNFLTHANAIKLRLEAEGMEQTALAIGQVIQAYRTALDANPKNDLLREPQKVASH